MPKMHKREFIVKKAEIELNSLIIQIRQNLTEGEYLRVISNVFHGCLANIAKWQIREERHPKDLNKPGAWE